jgi:rod shape-determining protein MreC
MADTRDDFIIAIRYALLKKSAKQKFSLIFLISFSILIIVLDKQSVSFINTTRAVLNDFVYKATIAATVPAKVIVHLGNIKKNHFHIVNKNKILEEELEALKSERYDILFLKTENKNLKEFLSLGKIATNEEDFVIPARVILDQKSPYLRSLLISKGKNHGIIKGMTVFSKGYLIGRVIEANYLSARILLVTDLNSKIPVIIQDTDVNAILVGAGKKTNLFLEYLPDEFLLEPNKIIYTSGKDGMLTAGIPVAETFLNNKNVVQIKSLANPRQALIVHITNGQMKK